jgi:hypothetical protein
MFPAFQTPWAVTSEVAAEKKRLLDLRRVLHGASNLVALWISYSCDQNGGKRTLRLAAVHPNWKHHVETTAKCEASGIDFRHRGKARGGGSHAAATDGKTKEVEFIRLEARGG